MRTLTLLLPVLLLGIRGSAAPLRYNRDIRPLLSDNCFHCHGPDAKARKGNLRLDLREEALKPAKSNAVPIVPGKPDDSEVIKRILTTDADDTMPPEEAHKILTAQQKSMLRQWIAEGATYEAHWAYTPLSRPPVPKVSDVNWVRTPVDAFILEKLVAEGVKPSAEADKRTLIRRLSLDLIGLPPTPEETQAYLADLSPDAWKKQVERLLANPHFGERWAAWWLDAARFTDTVGFHGDQNQRIFPYRDYVIDAFNKNLRFDQFTLEQLAGDLIPNATPEQKVASGFNRLNMMTREGGAQPREYLAKYGAERTRTVATTWLGSTFACAECHDHKFDPFTQKDFYSLQAFFADLKQWGVYNDYGYTPNPDLKGFSNEHPFPPEIQVESAYLKERAAKLHQEMVVMVKAASGSLEKPGPERETYEKWLTNGSAFLKEHSDGWVAPVPKVSQADPPPPKKQKAKVKSQPKPEEAKNPPPSESLAEKAKESPYTVASSGTITTSLVKADNTSVSIPVPPGMTRLASLRLELQPSPNHKNMVWRTGKSESVLVRLSARLLARGAKRPQELGVFHAEATAKEPRYSNGEEVVGIKSGWRTSAAGSSQAQAAVYLLANPVPVAVGDVIAVELPDNLAAAFRVSLSPFAVASPDPEAMDRVRAALATALPADGELCAQYLAGTAWNAEAFQKMRGIASQIFECRGGKAWSLVSEAVPNPLTLRVLPRGNWQDESGEVVSPQAPHNLPQIPNPENRRLNRADLAKWLCSKNNPLTGRAVMNRLWKQFFGNGLSGVIDDLGAQGEAPSHPELLDWLAVEFRECGWDFKAMIRQVVLSGTYRQSSNLRAELRDRDPTNRWLTSQNPRRLDAEFIRDNALAIAGLLNPEMGGPSVKPYQPAGYYANLQFPDRNYVADADDRQWRRGVYMHWQRTFLHPMLANFDAPMRDECAAARIVSNTPQQALTLLNDPTFSEAARVFAQHLLQLAAVDDSARLTAAWQRTLGREPKTAEAAGLLKFLEEQRASFKIAAPEAAKLAASGLALKSSSSDTIELAAWTMVCRVLLNLHETVTRY